MQHDLTEYRWHSVIPAIRVHTACRRPVKRLLFFQGFYTCDTCNLILPAKHTTWKQEIVS
jgi:hypothetical protein